jgi:hypothetical protein
MVDWSFPKVLKSLKGYLGLTSYYRKFIQGYGFIDAPLTAIFLGMILQDRLSRTSRMQLLEHGVSLT